MDRSHLRIIMEPIFVIMSAEYDNSLFLPLYAAIAAWDPTGAYKAQNSHNCAMFINDDAPSSVRRPYAMADIFVSNDFEVIHNATSILDNHCDEKLDALDDMEDVVESIGNGIHSISSYLQDRLAFNHEIEVTTE